MADDGTANRRLVLVPLDREQAARLLAGERMEGPVPGVTANRALCETFGVEMDSEDADLAAFQVACVRALGYGERLVLVARVPSGSVGAGPEAHNGGVGCAELGLRSVEAFFSDDDPAASDAVAIGAAGLDVDAAWSLPQVQELLAEHPMLWHDVTELAGHINRQERR